MADQGKTRDEIGAATGLVLGVANASLTIEEGEILVLMGLSGWGKSTLLRAVNGLAPVVRGDVAVSTATGSVNPYKCNAKALRELRTHTVSMQQPRGAEQLDRLLVESEMAAEQDHQRAHRNGMEEGHFVFRFQTRDVQENRGVFLHRLGDRRNHRRHVRDTDRIAIPQPGESLVQHLHGFLDGLARGLDIDLDVTARQAVGIEPLAGVDDDTGSAAFANFRGINLAPQRKPALGQKRILPQALDGLHKHSDTHLAGVDTLEHPVSVSRCVYLIICLGLFFNTAVFRVSGDTTAISQTNG